MRNSSVDSPGGIDLMTYYTNSRHPATDSHPDPVVGCLTVFLTVPKSDDLC